MKLSDFPEFATAADTSSSHAGQSTIADLLNEAHEGRKSSSIAENSVQMSDKPSSRRLRIPVSIKLILAGVFALGIIYQRPIADNYAILSSPSTPAIIEVANNTGLNTHGKAIFYRTNPELVDANVLNSKCPHESQDSVEYGCYIPNENKMYILLVSDQNYKDIQYTIAAHETLHAAWIKLSSSDRETISTELKTLYDTSTSAEITALKETMKFYGDDQDVMINEFHSFMGTELPDTALNDKAIDYYKRYFSDRTKSINSNTAFDAKIDAKIASMNAQHQQLGIMDQEIAGYKSQWLDTIETYMNRARRIGDTNTYNKNVDAYNNNLISYNQKIDNYNMQRDSYNAEVDKFNALLESFRPTASPLQTK